MKGQKRRTRSDKFPLTLHPTGQYCKKIKGKIPYFGTDKKRALERYLEQAAYFRVTPPGSEHSCPPPNIEISLSSGTGVSISRKTYFSIFPYFTLDSFIIVLQACIFVRALGTDRYGNLCPHCSAEGIIPW